MKSSGNKVALDETPLSLLDLPNEIDAMIVNQVPDNAIPPLMITLSTTCSRFGFFRRELEHRAAATLLAYVLQGNATKAKAMYTVNPRLLFIETIAEDYAAGIDEQGNAVHRRIVSTPYGAMLGAGDIWMLAEIPTYYFNLVIDQENGKTFRQLAAEQFSQQFPHGVDYPPSTYDFSLLVETITNDQLLIQTGEASSATKEILAQFRKDFMPGTVREGHHFNVNELIKAYELYHKNEEQWNKKQIALFACQVIGYLERLVSAVDAQALSQGIPHIVVRSQSVERSFKLLNPYKNLRHREMSYFPLDANPKCRLGLNFLVDSLFGWWYNRDPRRKGEANRGAANVMLGLGKGESSWVLLNYYYTGYVQQKQQNLQTLCSNCNNNHRVNNLTL